MKRLSTYREFLEFHGYQHLLQDPQRLVYAHTQEIRGCKIGIAGLNSA